MKIVGWATAVCLSVALTGCASITPATPERSGAAASSGAPNPGAATSATPSPTPEPVTAAELETEFAALRERTQDELVIAWAPIGRPEEAQQLGVTDTYDAWSTIKVPIALAAVQQRDGEVGASLDSDIRLALRRSDNDAASRLWRGLGQFGDPASIVDDLLTDAGDTTTDVGHDLDGDRVSFGLTDWAPIDAARFAASLPCLDHSDEILDDMSQVASEQSWGLGALTGADEAEGESSASATGAVTDPGGQTSPSADRVAFKGGWGVSSDGYLMRQIGVIPTPDGSGVGVALLTQPSGDDHDAGGRALSEAARWLQGSLTAADAARCETKVPAPRS